jgi:hypothetical protein
MMLKFMSASDALTTRDIFNRAFRPQDSWGNARTLICVLERRKLVAPLEPGKRPGRYVLTPKGQATKEAIYG